MLLVNLSNTNVLRLEYTIKTPITHLGVDKLVELMNLSVFLANVVAAHGGRGKHDVAVGTLEVLPLDVDCLQVVKGFGVRR